MTIGIGVKTTRLDGIIDLLAQNAYAEVISFDVRLIMVLHSILERIS